MAQRYKKILIIKPSSLGDIVLALPALCALRRNFPQAEISWLVRPEFTEVLDGHKCLDEIIVFDRRFLGKAWWNVRAFRAIISLIGKLRKGQFDLVLDFQGLFRTAALGWLSGCRRRVGMKMSREFAHIFYTDRIEQTKENIHLVDYYLRMAGSVGCQELSVEFGLPVKAEAVESVNKLLNSHGVDGDNYAVFIPSSAHIDKCWPIARVAELADRIAEEFGLSIIATGTASEKNIVEELQTTAKVSIINFAGLTSISELIVLLKGAGLVISNDTGPGHIGAAMDVPIVMIFGRSNPARVAPYGRSSGIAAIEPYDRGFDSNSIEVRHDIKAVTVDDVYKKVCEQMPDRDWQ